jgi:polar amino acid transport system substrate-binding protein
MKRIISASLCTVAVVAGLAACGNPSDGTDTKQAGAADAVSKVTKDPAIAAMLPKDVAGKGSFTVSINPDAEPIKFLDSDGEISGLNPDLLRAAAKVLGVKVTFQTGTFDAMVPGLESKRYDAIASIADFVERQKKIDFIDYVHSGTAILAAKGLKQDKITSTDELCGLSVGYVRGTSQQGSLETVAAACDTAGKPKLAVNGYPDAASAILSVKSGQADAFWGDRPSMLYNVDKSPKLYKIIYEEVTSVYGIGVNKDDPQLRDALRAALLKLVDDGVYDTLLEQWGLKQLALPTMDVNSDNTLGK